MSNKDEIKRKGGKVKEMKKVKESENNEWIDNIWVKWKNKIMVDEASRMR